jgi:hypothetical protein
MTIADSDWSKDRLMGKSVSFKGIGKDGQAATPSTHHNKEKIDPMLWGRPGHLSEEEADIYVSLVPMPFCCCRCGSLLQFVACMAHYLGVKEIVDSFCFLYFLFFVGFADHVFAPSPPKRCIPETDEIQGRSGGTWR